ncbi:MAG: hypothetical protein QF835_01875 [Candidatus Marinimicrobia bacterium]|jgi:hypothetical protein|nr:hypothetical protein [Candidatus Neomarinimicrobiota bacterium]
MNRKKLVTLKSIAEELQLSKVTISKALHNRTDVSTERKALVLDSYLLNEFHDEQQHGTR